MRSNRRTDMEPLSRRNFIFGGLAAFGASTFIPGSKFGAQNVAAGSVEGLEDMDKAGISTAFTSIIGPGIWFGNIADTRRLARECNDFAAKLVRDYPVSPRVLDAFGS